MPSELGFPRYPQVTETTQDGYTRLRVVGSRVPQRPLVFPVHGVDVEDGCTFVPRVVPRKSERSAVG
jgi:hypothetical protein